MFGGDQQLFNEVVRAVDMWIPSKEYGHEAKFQNELQDFLDTKLNANSQGGHDIGLDSADRVVERESGRSRADVVVNQRVGIEMKRDLSNSQTKKLRGQIEALLDEYPFVIVCACGIQDMDGWRKLKNTYQGRRGDIGMDISTVEFIEKDPANYGKDIRREDDGGMFDNFGI